MKFKQSGTVLDLGSGVGRHALFLAKKGFQVTAVELELAKLAKLQDNAKKLGLAIKTVQANIGDFQPQGTYDAVVATMTLHFLAEDRAKEVIRRMQESTSPGGLNVITAYTEENPKGLRPYLFKKGELREFYKDWEVLQYEESLGPRLERPKDGGPERRYRALLMARKTGQ